KSPEKIPEKALEGNPFDDLEFLKTMVDKNSGDHGTVSAPQPGHAAESVGSSPAPEPLQTMPMSPPMKQRPSQAVPVAASGLPLIMPDAPGPQRPEPRFPQAAGGAAGGRDTVPSYLKESPPEQVKTLKCQECGTLNYPTEWYCERCGAELAAL
ncbi:MAG TPA: zinc finger Ran-binding domain-containing protein, partial [Gemmatimonadaceae bacterium]